MFGCSACSASSLTTETSLLSRTDTSGSTMNQSDVKMSYGLLIVKLDILQGLHSIITTNIHVIAARALVEWKSTSSQHQ